MTREELFWAKVSKCGPDDCWIWTAGKQSSGHGHFWTGKTHRTAHRMAMEYSGVDVPDDKLVCHRCNIPACVNPAHLYVGTYKDNMRDRMEADAWVQPHPGFGSDHPQSKLTWSIVEGIRARHARGAKMRALAREHGVCLAAIQKILKRETWRVPA